MKLPTLLAAAVTLAVPAVAVAATSAGAATAPVLATLSACGNGSSAAWSGGNAHLTVGTGAAGTCGSPPNATYNPAYAQEVLQVKGGVVPTPTTETKFTTDNYASGSPRIVIDLGNGHSLWGYPANSGLNGSDMAWAVDNGNTYTNYTTAYNNALAYQTTVKDAFVVEDADQMPGTADTIGSFTYGGTRVEAQVVLSHGHVVSVSNNRAEVAWTATPPAAKYKVVLNGPGFRNRINYIKATTAYYEGLAAGSNYAFSVTPLDVNRYLVGATGHIDFMTK